MPRKNVKFQIGDLFLVPRADGKFVVGQVLENWLAGIHCVAIFDWVVSGTHTITTLPAQLHVIALPSVSSSEIKKGYWKVAGNLAALVDIARAPHSKFKETKFIGASWVSGGLVEDMVNAYYSMIPWDFYPKRPGALHELLLGKGNGEEIDYRQVHC